MQLVFDIETNGLLPDVDTLHVCCTYDIDTQEEWYSTDPKAIVAHLSKATHLICHNLIDYDLPVLEKLTGFKPNDNVRITDTLVLSRLGNPDRQRPKQMVLDRVKSGPHALAAWGYRVGRGKPEHEDWSTYNEAMLHRCCEDVRINAAMLPLVLKETSTFGESVSIEHEVQRIISKQERTGVYFDKERAVEYVTQLRDKVREIDERLISRLPRHARRVGVSITKPFKKDGSLTKKIWEWCIDPFDPEHPMDMTGINPSWISGPFTRIEYYQTDLNSDKQVKEWLLSIGWKPLEWNTSPKTGDRTSPILTPESFGSLPEGIGNDLKERVTWRHRASQIQGWIDKCRADHCLSAGANPMGTNTGRMRQRTVVNVPKASVFDKGDSREGQLWLCGEISDEGDRQPIPFGTEMRSLFTHRRDRVFVGHDASGLELRMLAHYMNDKEFIEQILYGEIHSYNQRLAGLPSRYAAKAFIYAFIYGAGDAKLGSLINGSKADGTRLRATFLSALPKLGQLIDKVKKASLRGYLIGLDGRKIYMRKDKNGNIMQYKALNTLLQCAGVVVMKKSIILLDESSRDLDAMKVIDMHDEGQADVSLKDAELYGELAVQSIRQAGIHFNLNIPLDAEAKIGANWAVTH